MKSDTCHSSRRTPATLTQWVLAAALLTASGCAFPEKMGLVTVTADSQGFLDARSSQPYVPWGTNYYDPNTGWSPKVWQQFDADRVAEHFDLMKELGVNCARIFLAAAAFQPDADTVSEEALEKLDTVVKIARRTGIRLILTRPDHWEGEPPYWTPDRFAGPEALRALENFWTVVGQRYRDEPTIFAWDLLNEPSMPWSVESWNPRWNDWLKSKYLTKDALQTAWGDELKAEETFGSVEPAKDTGRRGNPRLLDWQLFREHLADDWVRRQVEVLRRVDPSHLITVGYIQWSYSVIRPGDPSIYSAFNPHRQARWLDFISIHFYPLMGRPWGSKTNWDRNLAYLQSILAYCQTGKPLVLSEYGWYGGGAPPGRPIVTEDQQGRWITAEIDASRRFVQGWLSWPFADTPEATDMSVFGGLVRYNFVYKLWALRFRSYAQNLAILPQPAPELPPFDVTPSLTAPLEDLMAMHQKHAARIQEALEKAGPVPEIKLQTRPLRIGEIEQGVMADGTD